MTLPGRIALFATAAVSLCGCGVAPPEPRPLTDDVESRAGDVAACTMEAIRAGGRGTLVTTLGPSSAGQNYSAFRANYTPTDILKQCCTDIGYVQLVKEDNPGWDFPSWEVDREEDESQNPWPQPWYPYQTPFKQGASGVQGRLAFMMDDPGGYDGVGGGTFSITMSFESCAVCAIGTPAELSNRILACADWEIDYGDDTNSRELNGSSTLYVAPDGTPSQGIRSTTIKAPMSTMKSKTGMKDLLDQAL
ncbi:MAG: hypothetical protein P8Y01_00785 [Woeseiaceae bacterium]